MRQRATLFYAGDYLMKHAFDHRVTGFTALHYSQVHAYEARSVKAACSSADVVALGLKILGRSSANSRNIVKHDGVKRSVNARNGQLRRRRPTAIVTSERLMFRRDDIRGEKQTANCACCIQTSLIRLYPVNSSPL